MNPRILMSDACPLALSKLSQLANATAEGEREFRLSVREVKGESDSYSGSYEVGPGESAVFLKCYSPNGSLGRALVRASRSRPFRAYQAASAIAREFPIPAPLALLANVQSQNVYYFSTLVRGVTLADFVYQHIGDPPALQAVLANTAAGLARFHQRGWLHGDFKWSNVLVGPPNDGSDRIIHFIDLDSVNHSRALTRERGRGRDIARFLLNAEDNGAEPWVAEFFVQNYSQAMAESPGKTQAIARRRLEKLRRRHREKYGKPAP